MALHFGECETTVRGYIQTKKHTLPCMDKKDHEQSTMLNHFELKNFFEWICIYSFPWYLTKKTFEMVFCQDVPWMEIYRHVFFKMNTRFDFVETCQYRQQIGSSKRFVLIHLQTSTYLPYACSWNYRPFFLNPLPTLVHLRPWQIARTVLGFLLQRVGNGHGEVGVWIPPQSRKENRPMGVKASFYRKWFYKYPVLLGLWSRSFSCLQSRRNLRWLRLLKLINTSDHDACMHTKLRTVFVVTYFSTTTNHKILQFLSWYFYPTIDPVFTTHGFKQTLYNYGLWSFPILERSQETFWDTPMTARISLGKMR